MVVVIIKVLKKFFYKKLMSSWVNNIICFFSFVIDYRDLV